MVGLWLNLVQHTQGVVEQDAMLAVSRLTLSYGIDAQQNVDPLNGV